MAITKNDFAKAKIDSVLTGADGRTWTVVLRVSDPDFVQRLTAKPERGEWKILRWKNIPTKGEGIVDEYSNEMRHLNQPEATINHPYIDDPLPESTLKSERKPPDRSKPLPVLIRRFVERQYE